VGFKKIIKNKTVEGISRLFDLNEFRKIIILTKKNNN